MSEESKKAEWKSLQPSYTQKRTVKRILIRCGSHGYSAIFTHLDYAALLCARRPRTAGVACQPGVCTRKAQCSRDS